ncbi:MAG: molybdopterin molybdotransferase MoeA [Bacteroidia bacterium]
MISTIEAKAIIFSTIKDFGVEEVLLENALGRVLREEIVGDRDFPPYNRVTMDGIAIRFSEYENGLRSFDIEGIAAAGSPQQHLEKSQACLEVMTGSIMPTGLDTVIPYEQIEITKGKAKIGELNTKLGKNIHIKGFDKIKGDTLIKAGKQIEAPEIGICSTVGKSKVLVSRLPRVIVISTGDELVNIEEVPLPHQIRKSNIFRLKSELQKQGIKADTIHLNDDFEEIKNVFSKIFDRFDVVMLSGGVSKGKFDFLPQALEAKGVEKRFHRIAQRPGKPFWFGTYENKCHVFAFPGNPISSFMCMQAYFNPWLNASLQLVEKPSPKAVLANDVEFKPNLTFFCEVAIDYSEKGELLAIPVRGHGSGDLANLVRVDGYLVLEQGKDLYKAGEVYELIPFRGF